MYNNFSSKKTKKVISALLASALVVTSAPITADAATSKVLGVGKTFKVTKTTKVSGLSAAEKKIVKVTVNKSKKTVTVKGLKAGKAAFKIGSKSYNVKVGATAIKAKSFATTLTVGTNKSVSVTATNGKKDTLTWKSSQTGVVKVSKATTTASSSKVAKNTLKPVKAGKSTITVKSKYTGKYLKVKVTVKAADATVTAAPTATGGAVATPAQTPTQAPAQTPSAQETQNPVQTPSAQETQNPATQTPNLSTATEGAITVTANVSGASIQVLSGSSLVAAVNMDADKTSVATGVLQPGVYTIEVSKDGYDTYTSTVTVDGSTTVNATLKETLKTGASASVTNALADYPDTVLVNDNAIVTVKVTDSTGAPLANKTLVVSKINDDKFSETHDSYLAETGETADERKYEIKGDSVITTNADGQASFIIGANAQGLKANNKYYVGTAEYRASVVGSTNANDVVTGVVKFASIDVGTVSPVKDADGNYSDVLVTGTEAKAAGYNDIENAIASTVALSGAEAEYISTQQVSKTGTRENEVSFKVTPQIILPTYAGKTDAVDKFVQPLDEKSGEYGTYESQSKVIPLKVEASSLQYATLNFDNIQLSQYTKMTIECYTTKDAKAKSNVPNSRVEILGEKEQSKFAYQIPLTDGDVKSIKVTLESEGQVQTDKNDGYTITNIEGVYKKAGVTADGGAQDLTTATVDWVAENPTYSNEMPLTAEEAVEVLGIKPNDGKKYTATESTFKYQVPVFPNTGNAVIKEYDSNKKLVAYYLAPTKNNYKTTTAGTKIYDNTNDISALVEHKNNGYVASGMKAYKATEEEATTPITTDVTVKDNVVTVDSEKVGYTNLKGTISITGIGTDQLNALNSEVFTSVQWNPTPIEKDKEVENSDEFLALAGQKITVYAQLRDANNNPVSKSGKAIKYKVNDTEITGSSVGDVTVLSGITDTTNKTDVNGRATLELKAATATELCDLTAEIKNNDGSTEEFKVTLTIGDKNVKSADLYWVDANLSFTNRVLADAEIGKENKLTDYVEITTNNNSMKEDVAEFKVGTPWKIAVETVGNEIGEGKGELSGYEITIDGLNIAMSSASDNKGTYDFTTGNGVALATSSTAQKDEITARINENSVSSNVKFTATKTDAAGKVTTKEYNSVGTGSPNLNAKLTLGIEWQAEGYKLAMVTPYGTNAAYNADETGKTKVCVKVTDETGKNVVADKAVTFTSGNLGDILAVEGGAAGTSNVVEAVTNSNGIATIEVKRDATNKVQSSIIKAEVQNVADIASTTINWVEKANPFGLVNARVTNTAKTEIELTFNNDVYAGSVQPGEFKVTGEESGKIQTYDVTNATVNGNKVTLTLGTALPANEYTVTIGSKKVDGIVYNVVDETASTLVAGKDTINFYSEKSADFAVTAADQNDGTVDITIDEFDSPVLLTDLDGDGDTDKDDVKKYLETYVVVTIDGVIYKYDGTNLTNGTVEIPVSLVSDGTLGKSSLKFNLAKGDAVKSVNVYVLGEVNSVRVAKN